MTIHYGVRYHGDFGLPHEHGPLNTLESAQVFVERLQASQKGWKRISIRRYDVLPSGDIVLGDEVAS